MAMPLYRTRGFLELRKKWDERLRKAGFKDIERLPHRGEPIQDLSERIHFKNGINTLTEAYYSWANQQLQIAKFRTAKHKRIWRAHCDGDSAAAIGRALGLSRWRISDILTEIKSYLTPAIQRK